MGAFDLILYVWKYSNSNDCFKKIAVIDNAKSIIWVTRYNLIGEFEIYMPVSSKVFEWLQVDNIVTQDNSDRAMIIEKIKISTDNENGNFITASGRSAESVLSRRVVSIQHTYSGTAENVIRQILTEEVINPSVSVRKMNFITLGAAQGYSDTVEKQITGQSVLDAISDLCSTYNYGFRLIFQNGIFTFEIYKGVDRSATVIFSSEYENIGNTECEFDSTPYANCIFVGGEGEGSARAWVEVDTELKEGLFLREKVIDARQISSKVEGGQLAPSQYGQLLEQRGKEELSTATEVRSFGGEILVTPTANQNYGLGDTVTVENNVGISGTADIIELNEVEDDSGYKNYPTLSAWRVN